MAQRTYFPMLLFLVRKLCVYYARYSGKLPTDLPSSVNTAMAALTVACSALELYDALHAPGKPANS